MEVTRDQEIPILVQETKGIPRWNEPVTVGIPLSMGLASDSTPFGLCPLDGGCVSRSKRIY